MPAYTSTTSGLFSAGVTWVGGVAPSLSGDTFTIASGHNVIYDGDNSAHAAGWGASVVTGTLSLCTTPGTYWMKLAGHLTGAGLLAGGTSLAVPYPSGCKTTIQSTGNYYIGVNNNALYNLEPAIKSVKLTAPAGIGDTVLNVDTDVTTDIWAAGDLIRVDDIAGTLPDSEERTIAAGGIAATTITITAGLTAAKATGSWVHLITRNITIIGAGAGTAYLFFNQTGNVVVAAELRNTARGFYSVTGASVIGGTSSGMTTAVFNGNFGSYISAGVFSGNGQINGSDINMEIVGGIFTGHTTGFFMSSVDIMGGTFSGNNTLLSKCRGKIGGSVILENNTWDTDYACDIRGYKAAITNVKRFVNDAAGRSVSGKTQIVIRNHAGIENQFRGWMYGGTIADVATALGPFSWSYQFTPLRTDVPTYFEEDIYAPAGVRLLITVWTKMSATGFAERMTAQLFDASLLDPFYGGTPIASFVSADNTDEQTTTVLYVATKPTHLILRLRCANGSGTALAQSRVRMQQGIIITS